MTEDDLQKWLVGMNEDLHNLLEELDIIHTKEEQLGKGNGRHLPQMSMFNSIIGF